MDEYKLEGGSFYDDYNEVLEDCKAYSHKIDSLHVVCMDMEKKEYPEILSVKFMLQQKNGMEIF